MKHRNLLLSIATSSALALGACTVSTDPVGGAPVPIGKVALPFKPSNIQLPAFDAAELDAVVLSGRNCTLDSEAPIGRTDFPCAEGDVSAIHSIVTLDDQSKVSVFVFKSLRIEASTVLKIDKGHLPVVLVALDTMTLLGSIEVAPGYAGGAFGRETQARGAGPGGGGGGSKIGGAPAGGTYCGSGGKGGASALSTPGMPAAPYGAATLIPLVGGSAGGSGDLTNEGDGGGALQLVAGGAFTLGAQGYVSAPGGGGQFGGITLNQTVGAGGSGGAILIESMQVNIDGRLAANGGAGAQGENGQRGTRGNAEQSQQNHNDPTKAASGGAGSFAGSANGGSGTSSLIEYPSGAGGGGAGRVRINSKIGQTTIAGSISPALQTACATQGAITL